MKRIPCPYCGGFAKLGFRAHGQRFRENLIECQCGQFTANIDRRCLMLNWFGQRDAICQTPIVIRKERAA
jgi:hypothetical protein